jgi:hypothetical protein
MKSTTETPQPLQKQTHWEYVENHHDGPKASVRCVAAIRPESGVKPTYQDRSTDAFDPEPTLTSPFCCDAQLSLPNDMLWCGTLPNRLGASLGGQGVVA